MRELLQRCAKAILIFQGAALVTFGAFGFCYAPGVVAFWTQLPGLWLLHPAIPKSLEGTLFGGFVAGCHEGITLVGAVALFLANAAILLAATTAAVVLVRCAVVTARAILRELADLGGIAVGGCRPLVRGAFRQGLLAARRDLPP